MSQPEKRRFDLLIAIVMSSIVQACHLRVRSRMSRQTPRLVPRPVPRLIRQTTPRWRPERLAHMVPANGEAQSEEVAGDPNRIRTCNPRSRNPLLYPVELWDRNFRPRVRPLGLHSIANMKKSPSGQAVSEPFPAAKRPTGTVDLCVRSALNAMFAPQISRRRSKGHASAMSCEFFGPLFPRHESVTFSRISVRNAAFVRAQGAPS